MGIVIVGLLSAVNMRGIRTGAVVQNVFTFAKTAALLGLVAIGFLLGRNPAAVARNFGHFWDGAGWSMHVVRLIGVAMVGSLFSADAWNNVTFTAGEVRNPRRNLPISLALGVAIVMALYISANCVYLNVLPFEAIQHAPEDRVATAAMKQILGPAGVQIMAAAIMISCFGCVNGLILAGARVYYAMSLDKLFFRKAGTLGARHHAPVFALAIQGIWAMILTLKRHIQRSARLRHLRRAGFLYPDHCRYLRAASHASPDGAALQGVSDTRCCRLSIFVAASLIEILLLAYKPNYTWPGLIIVLLGVPVYFIWKPKSGVLKG